MRISDEITLGLLSYGVVAHSDIVLPNYYMGRYEMDVCKINGSQYVTEYEIKISRSDFFADFKKQHTHWRDGKTVKHQQIESGEYVANRFYYVVPQGLIKLEEVPKYAGLIEYVGGFLEVKKAPLLHKRRFTNYASIVNTLAARERQWRINVRKVKRENENLRSQIKNQNNK